MGKIDPLEAVIFDNGEEVMEHCPILSHNSLIRVVFYILNHDIAGPSGATSQLISAIASLQTIKQFARIKGMNEGLLSPGIDLYCFKMKIQPDF